MRPLHDGESIPLSHVGCARNALNLEVQVVNEPKGARVHFWFQGQKAGEEGAEPYRMYGDSGERNTGQRLEAGQTYIHFSRAGEE